MVVATAVLVEGRVQHHQLDVDVNYNCDHYIRHRYQLIDQLIDLTARDGGPVPPLQHGRKLNGNLCA